MRNSVSLFDKRSFGGWMLGWRKYRYSNADDFAKAITEKTGYPVTGRTILNLENGKHEPCLSLVLAISYTLTGNMLDEELVRIIKRSGSSELAARLAFPEIPRSEYEAITVSDGDVSVYFDGDENGGGGQWLTKPNPLNQQGKAIKTIGVGHDT